MGTAPGGGRARALAAFLLVLAAGDTAADWYGPEPFRRDRLEGREFSYNAESFLHRFSFEPMPATGPERYDLPDGMFGTGGSTRTDELYLRAHVHATLNMDGPGYLGYRFRRDEDFDGRYERNLLGIGARQPGWDAALWADVHAAKQDLDLQADLRLEDDAGSHIRLAVAAPEAIHNSKRQAGDSVYERRPYTYYASGTWQLPGEHAVYGFVDRNARTRLRDEATGVRVDDERLGAGVGVALSLGPAWTLGAEVEGLRGTREQVALDEPVAAEQDLERSFDQATVELRQRLDGRHRAWYGVRYFRLVEDDRRPQDADAWRHIDRRERTLYGGLRWQWRDTVALRPGVLLHYVDNSERHPLAPENDDTDEGFYGKLTPAVEFLIDRRSGAFIVVNPTVRLHEAAFGGGNVQLYVPL